jgi:trehalose 6-phosphate synthase/phosphatase
MSQVIIVSNRLPVSVKKEGGKLRFSPSLGGVATGLSSYVNDKRNLWIGWPGIASDELTEQDREEIVAELATHNCSPVFLTQKQVTDFYNGYSNTVLWPLLHELSPQDKPGKERERWYRSYRAVNKLFAETVEVAVKGGSRVWVQDYQLLLVPEMLRAMDIDATIGFFLHVPFPQPEKFAVIPNDRKLLKGMLGADQIGFHTPGYVENFLKVCEAYDLGTAGDRSLRIGERSVRVADFPMGIDYDKYASAGKSKAVKAAVRKYRHRYRGQRLIVAVDRLDPSKGLAERLEAYDKFLQQYPQLHGKVTFAMVAAPSRTDVPAYQQLSKKLSRLVERINTAYGTAKWQPVDYINRSVPFEEVTALFQIADVAFIAPLKDGMNLAAKEFVASARSDSVLILSETAGAAQELHDALIVNPQRPDTVVRALYDSLTRPRSELKRRLKRMKNHLRNHTVQMWAKDFITTLGRPLPNAPLLTYSLEKYETQLQSSFAASQKRLLLLDYDGTLMPFKSDPRKVVPTKSLLDLITKLGSNPHSDVVIISGRSAANLEEWFGGLPIHLVAEHGAAYKEAGKKKWQKSGSSDDTWKRIPMPVLEKYATQAPGAHVEEKAHSLVWHYRDTPPYYAQKYAVIIRSTLRPFLQKYGLEIMKGNKVLEIKNPAFSKGNAARRWLDADYDFVLGAGDDTTDEELFKAMPATSYSIKVGHGRTAAHYRVASPQDVMRLLRKLVGDK